MLSAYNIYSIALYEMKNLVRSWFFRIFSLLSLIIIVLLNVALFGTERQSTMMQALPSFIPYLNILLLNVVQAIIGGFMASDFMKYDKKLDTTDVIYMRSMTNADYVFGKTLGVLIVFGGLNLLVLVNAFIFNVIVTDGVFLPKLYVLYPLLISLPTLLFIFGLSFMLMALIRSQALTFVILLGYIASTLFFLGNTFHYIFDYMAFNVPLVYSDFIGFGNLDTMLVHRGIYLLFGVGFISLTVLLIKRLPQSRFVNGLSLAVSICCFVIALFFSGQYLANLSAGKNLRASIIELNRREVGNPIVDITSCSLNLEHNGDRIGVDAELTFTNQSGAAIDNYIFSLNPGLSIGKITADGRDLTFTRDIHLVTVEPPEALPPDGTGALTISYSGTIDEDACFPEVDESLREGNFRFLLYNIGKRYGFITPKFVLLTAENLWYPVAGIPYGAAYPRLQKNDFIDFTLTVATKDGLIALSQGEVTSKGGGSFSFKPENPLPRLSLVIGEYEKRSVTVDDIEYSLYIRKGHDFFSQYFTDIGEKLPELISDTKMRYEDTIGMEYPHKRFTLVETPIQYFTYPRLWTLSQETVQPEQVLLPEKAALLFNADFRQRSFWMQRMSDRGNRAMTPEEMQSGLFTSFVTSTLTNPNMSFASIRRGVRVRTGGGFSAPRLFIGGIPQYFGVFSVFHTYYTYSRNLSTVRWPILTTAFEMYLNERTTTPMPSFFRNIQGLSDEERANLELMKRSLNNILENPTSIDDAHNVLKMTSKYLFALMESRAGTEEFDNFVNDMLDKNRFVNIDAETFTASMRERFGFDPEPYFDALLQETKLSAFLISAAQTKEIIENEKTLYQVTLSITNSEPVDGIVAVNVRTRGDDFGRGRGGGGMGMMFGGMGDDQTQRLVALRGGETKEIGIVLNERPANISVDTYISQNIPSVIEKQVGRIESDETVVPFDGERILDKPVEIVAPGVIIVDNEDPGFEVQSMASASLLKKLINREETDEDEYMGMRSWNPPKRWSAATSSDFYGAYRLSAHYIRAGEGLNKAVWTSDLPVSGRYDVHYHVTEIRGPRFRRGGRGGRGGGGGERRREDDVVQDLHFTVHHDDGLEEVEIDASDTDEEWLLLGTFYFSEGRTVIEISDKSDGRIVYADAVKWTPRD